MELGTTTAFCENVSTGDGSEAVLKLSEKDQPPYLAERKLTS